MVYVWCGARPLVVEMSIGTALAASRRHLDLLRN
jgi:hypothetical protein